MKASELIRELQALVEEHGDLDVNHHDWEVVEVVAYDEDGNGPSHHGKPPVEFYIH